MTAIDIKTLKRLFFWSMVVAFLIGAASNFVGL